MTEQWKDIAGFEGRYQISDQGRVKALSFMQRWRHGLRRVRERIIAQQTINSGYLVVHMHLDNVETVRTVHRLVALAFCPGTGPDLEVNHIDGDKKNNAATNLEWLTRTANHNHAVDLGLNKQALRVIDPSTGVVYPSMARAMREIGCSHRTVSTWDRP